ncbi:baseplate J/gp47 family protein [Amorphus orientalis]|uniref:Phage-related baseplate assembly protein n=1 Tax=Amorphus orientalis TaxID=649198 RepID=A0AAE3VMN4_9HYPH|nr:baseplate J/gp47 family protein [Amorphus orientalis]MDQ0314852.1 phage-related baseplate assembly protein [Amorphus orientalis]
MPEYDQQHVETDPVIISAAEAWSYLRLNDRQRVNDAVKSVLAPMAKGTNLEAIVAGQNLLRLVVRPATESEPAVMESDAALLRRYLLSLDRPSIGSIGRYLLDAWTVWPGMGDARVNGRAVHGRLGDTDVVITGQGGADPTPTEIALVTAAVTNPNVKPEAHGVSVLAATRLEYSGDLVVEVPAIGPDAGVVRQEAEDRVSVAAAERTRIGGELPGGYLPSAAYGANVIKVRDLAPVTIEPDPYTVPVLASLSVTAEIRS